MASSVDAKLIKSTKFPPEYSKKVDREKVNLEVMKQWISGQVIGILGNEDDVVIDFIFGMLEEERFPDPKKIQINLTGFLEKDTPAFCKQLWNLLLSAQSNPQGVPSELLEQKKEELRQQRAEAEKTAEAQRRKREEEEKKDRNIAEIRERERGERRRGGPPPPERGRDVYQPRPRRSPSPANRHHRSPEIPVGRPPRREASPPRGGGRRDRFRERRETDTYIPSRRGYERRDFDNREGRSTRYGRSRSRSRSPPRRRDDYRRSSRRSPGFSRSPEPRRNRRDRSRSKSSDHGRKRRAHSTDRKGRDRHRSSTPSSLPSSSRSRSSRSSYESSSRSPTRSPPRKRDSSRRERLVSVERGVDRRRRSPSYTKSHADEKKGRRDERSRSRPRGEEHRHRHSPEDRVKSEERVREATPTKRRRSISPRDERRGESSKSRVKEVAESSKKNEIKKEDPELTPQQREYQLREKLLRERIKRSRKNSAVSTASNGSVMNDPSD